MQKHKIIACVIVVVLATVFKLPLDGSGYTDSSPQSSVIVDQNNNDLDKLVELIRQRKSGQMITIDARVVNILSDDVKGSKHQRFILEVLNSDYSLLLAHNIDLAPRVPVLKNDIIRVYGQYEWNDKGGVIHWTHRDKKNKHPHGWVEHNNKRYQ